jgi:molybdate transport system regulatory protein
MFQMKIWLIGGSSSGLGKSTLAKELMALLDGAVYLKLGHGKRKKDGPSNYFIETDDALEFIDSIKERYPHVVAEASRLIGKLPADVVIFLNRQDDNRRSDADNLLSKADIVLGDSSNTEQWMVKLEQLDLPVGIKKKILYAFDAQSGFITGDRLSIRTKVWFARDGKIVFGEGLARLLSSIDESGSLSQASKKEGISYRHAWGNIKRAEERMGVKLLERETGGIKGGGSKLTDTARKLIDGYWKIKRSAIQESDRQFEKLLKNLQK